MKILMFFLNSATVLWLSVPVQFRALLMQEQQKKNEKMKQEKVKYLIDMINNMDIKDKLRLAICMSQSKWSGLIYNTKDNYEKFDTMLKEIDEEYRITIINFNKYPTITFAMAKIMEMNNNQQNQIEMNQF